MDEIERVQRAASEYVLSDDSYTTGVVEMLQDIKLANTEELNTLLFFSS